MQKCNGKFCSNPAIKTVEDAAKCNTRTLSNHPKRGCFWHRQGEGCEECGGRVIRASACKMCVVCGWSA